MESTNKDITEGVKSLGLEENKEEKKEKVML